MNDSISKAERDRRRRMVALGEWDQTWITLNDNRMFFAAQAKLTPGGNVEFRDVAGDLHAITDLADVARAVH